MTQLEAPQSLAQLICCRKFSLTVPRLTLRPAARFTSPVAATTAALAVTSRPAARGDVLAADTGNLVDVGAAGHRIGGADAGAVDVDVASGSQLDAVAAVDGAAKVVDVLRRPPSRHYRCAPAPRFGSPPAKQSFILLAALTISTKPQMSIWRG